MKKNLIYGLIFIVGLFIILSLTGVLKLPFQSVITPPVQANMQNGQVYWYATLSGDSIKDGVGFLFNPKNSPYTTTQTGSYPVGTVVKPTDSTTVYFSNNGNYCTYILQPQQLSGLLTPTIPYSILSSPQRHIIVNVCNEGDCKNIDSTNIGSDILTFSANGGQMTVKGIGALVGQYNCPDASDVAIVINNNSAIYYSKSDLLSKYNALASSGGLLNLFANINYWANKPNTNNVFTSINGVASSPVYSNGNLLTVQMSPLSLGSGVVTLTADATFFKSSYIVPAQQASPKIDSLTVNDVKQGSSGTAKVTFHNTNSVTGTVSITANTQNSVISPSSQSYTLSNSGSVNLQVTASSSTGADSLTVKICSTGQTGSSTCDSKTAGFNVLTNNPNTGCGYNGCEANLGETYVTCPQDCNAPPSDPCSLPNPPSTCGKPLDCTAYSTWLIPSRPATSTGQSCILGFIACQPIVTNTCNSDYTLVVIGIIVLIAALITVYFMRRKK